MTPAPGLSRRLWTYQAERFPVFKHGLLIAVFAGSAVAYAVLLGARPGWEAWIVAGVVVFLVFFQLRVADEHKDCEDDVRFRPERPVPRGLIRLGELRALAIAAAAIQLAAGLVIDVRLLGHLVLVWTWMGLMTAEFFAPRWLKARPVLYLLSHMAVMPLIALFALACAGDGQTPWNPGAWAFLALTFCNGLALEVGRKAWAPSDEREGVETYSKQWGAFPAAVAVSAAIVAATGAVVWAQYAVEAMELVWLAPLASMGAVSIVLAYGWRPTPAAAGRVETTTGLFALAAYLSVSLIPLALRIGSG